MAFQLFIGNDAAKLARRLAAGLLETPERFRNAGDPLRKTRIVVQSRGMEVWLKQQFIACGVPAAVNPFSFFRIAPAVFEPSVASVGTPSTAASRRTSGALSNTDGKNSRSEFR